MTDLFQNRISRRSFLQMTAMAGTAAAAAGFSLLPRGVWAAEPEKKDVVVAVGGKNLYYYLPMAFADWAGYFKDEGLNVKVVDFQGGSKSLQAVVGGSADIVSGAFEHTLSMQTKRQAMRAFALQGRAPQCVFAVSKNAMKDFKEVAQLKGRRIGVTAPGSSSHVIANYVLGKAGIKPNEVSVIGIGSGSGAIAAVRAGQVDAFVGLDPVISQLEGDGIIQIVADTRVPAESDELFGGPMVAGCMYAPQAFIDRNPETCQRITNAVVRSLKFIHSCDPDDLMKIVPKAAFLGNPALYRTGFEKNRPALSTDGRFPEGCAQISAAALASVTPELKSFDFKYEDAFTNAFAEKVPV